MHIMDSNYKQYIHYSEELEIGIIGICLLEANQIYLVSQYLQSPDVFYFEKHKIIYEAMCRIMTNGGKVDLLTIVPEIHTIESNTKGEYASTRWSYECAGIMKDVVSGAHILEWCQILIQFWIKRHSIESASKIFSSSDPLQANRALNESIQKAMNFKNVKDWSDMSQIMIELQARRDRIKNGVIFGVPTGFEDFDEVTGGGFETGFHVICARPGMGKTALGLAIALNMANNGDPVGIVSLEMPNVQLASRLMSNATGIDFKTVFRGQKLDSQFYSSQKEQQINEAALKMASLPIYLEDKSSMNIFELRYKVAKLKREKKVKIIFIDYLQLMEVETEKGQARYVAVGNLSKGLKNLSKDLDIPIVALAQVNRESEGSDKQSKPAKLSQLRESGSIEQDVDMGIIIDRPFARGVTKDENEQSTEDVAFLDVQKHRNGETILIKIGWNPKTMKFYCPKTPQKELQYQHSNPSAGITKNTDPKIEIRQGLPF